MAVIDGSSRFREASAVSGWLLRLRAYHPISDADLAAQARTCEALRARRLRRIVLAWSVLGVVAFTGALAVIFSARLLGPPPYGPLLGIAGALGLGWAALRCVDRAIRAAALKWKCEARSEWRSMSDDAMRAPMASLARFALFLEAHPEAAAEVRRWLHSIPALREKELRVLEDAMTQAQGGTLAYDTEWVLYSRAMHAIRGDVSDLQRERSRDEFDR